MAQRWHLIRMYSAAESPAEDVLRIIREEELGLRVMLGVWIAPEERRDDDGSVVERFPPAVRDNEREVEAAVRLAAAYPEIVAAVCVGNETQVFWSGHRSPADILVRHVREVRARTHVPVTVADDFNFWNKPESRVVAREVDFIVTHYHPLWNGVLLPHAVEETRRVYASIRAAHPDRTVVLGETGWATQRHTEGEQAQLMKGESSEAAQAAFFHEITAWAAANRVPMFFFEAFDENWKGGAHPDEVEKHWGLYRADRTPKLAVLESSP